MLVVGGWICSYFLTVRFAYTRNGRSGIISHSPGLVAVTFAESDRGFYEGWDGEYHSAGGITLIESTTHFGFGFDREMDSQTVIFPFWFFTILSAFPLFWAWRRTMPTPTGFPMETKSAA
jgi:hypothetical protein